MTMSLRPKCVANPPATGVYVHDVCMTGQGERSKYMARRKSYQKGTVFKRGKKGNAYGSDAGGNTVSPGTARRGVCGGRECSAHSPSCTAGAKPSAVWIATLTRPTPGGSESNPR